MDAIIKLEYAKTFKAALEPMCNQYNPKPLPLCDKLSTISYRQIDLAVEPYFTKYVSLKSCKEIVEFYGSEVGKRLLKKMIPAIKNGTVPDFSSAEVEALDSFNHTNAGRELNRLAQDRSASLAIIQELNSK